MSGRNKIRIPMFGRITKGNIPVFGRIRSLIPILIEKKVTIVVFGGQN